MLVGDEAGKVEGVVGLFLGGKDESFAIEERGADILKCGIERDGGDAEQAVGIGEDGVGQDVGRDDRRDSCKCLHGGASRLWGDRWSQRYR